MAYGALANDLRSRATRLRNSEISVAGKGLMGGLHCTLQCALGLDTMSDTHHPSGGTHPCDSG